MMTKARGAKLYPKSKKDILFEPQKDGCLLFDKKNDRIHSLNKTAAAIWVLCDGKHSADKIETILKPHWEKTSGQTLSAEIRKTLTKFNSLDLLKK